MAILARDVMQAEPHTVGPRDSLADLERELLSHRIGGLPVVDRGRLVGIVSRSDIVRKLGIERVIAEEVSDFHRDLGGFQAPDASGEEAAIQVGLRLDGITVRDVMVDALVCVAADDPIGQVAQAMVEHEVHRVPVLDGERLVGLISTLDIVRLVADGRLRV